MGVLSILWTIVRDAIGHTFIALGTTAIGYWLVPITVAIITLARSENRTRLKAIKSVLTNSLAAAVIVWFGVFVFQLHTSFQIFSHPQIDTIPPAPQVPHHAPEGNRLPKNVDALNPNDIEILACFWTKLKLNTAVLEPQKFDGPAGCRVRITSNSEVMLKNALLRIYMIPAQVKIQTNPQSTMLPTDSGSEDEFYQIPISQTLLKGSVAFPVRINLPRWPTRYRMRLLIITDEGRQLGWWAIDIIPVPDQGG
jgi:hypothetical protein